MYLDKLLDAIEESYKITFEKEAQKPYPRDFVFDVDKTVRENREMVKVKNAEIHKEKIKENQLKQYKVEYTINCIIVALYENEIFLDKESAGRLVNLCLSKLGKNERKLYKWANVQNLVRVIQNEVEYLRKIFI